MSNDGECHPFGANISPIYTAVDVTDMQGSPGSAGVADRTRPKSRRSRLELAVVPSAVRIARHWTADQLTSRGPGGRTIGQDLIDSAVLVVSELVTNAIQAVTLSPATATQAAEQVLLARRILSFADLALPPLPAGVPAMPVTADATQAAPLTRPPANHATLVPGPALALPPPRVWLVIARYASLIRIEVHDTSPVPLPPARRSDDDDECGRGLTVVAALADAWGWRPARSSKLVWCEMAC